MHIKKFKVRKPRAGYQTPCAMETMAMLSCWAASKDVNNIGACAASAQAVAECMKTATKSGKRKQNTINYHLARFQKVLKRLCKENEGFNLVEEAARASPSTKAL